MPSVVLSGKDYRSDEGFQFTAATFDRTVGLPLLPDIEVTSALLSITRVDELGTPVDHQQIKLPFDRELLESLRGLEVLDLSPPIEGWTVWSEVLVDNRAGAGQSYDILFLAEGYMMSEKGEFLAAALQVRLPCFCGVTMESLAQSKPVFGVGTAWPALTGEAWTGLLQSSTVYTPSRIRKLEMFRAQGVR